MPRVMLLGLLVLLAGCGERGVNWSAPENLIVSEQTAEKDGAVQLEYSSLIDAPCKAIYDALIDVEHYPEFIPGVDTTQIIALSENSKTVLIAQRVISRQSNAKVQWTFDPARPHVAFKTLTSDFSFNDGTHEFESSPDGKRCHLRTTFEVKPAPGSTAVPLNVLAQATRDSFLGASAGVKKRATGAK